MTLDPQAVAEALKKPQWPAHRDASWHAAQDLIRDAARAWLAGRIIWWCEEHESKGSEPIDGYAICWYYGNTAALSPKTKLEPCRIVPVRLFQHLEGSEE